MAGNSNSSSNFAAAIVNLGTPRDGDIFVTRVANSGTRFSGFAVVDHAVFDDTLGQHSQEATYSVENNQLVITCPPFTETDAETTVVSVAEAEKTLGLQRARETVHTGAVSSHLFALPDGGIRSHQLGSLCAHPRVVKAYVSSEGINVLQAHDRQIEQGLVPTLKLQRSTRTAHRLPCSLPAQRLRATRALRYSSRQWPIRRGGKSFSASYRSSTRRVPASYWKNFW